MKQLFLLVVLLSGGLTSYAQSLLNKTVSVNANRKPLSAVLDDISMQGDFHFSYVKEFIHDDSLVTVNVTNRSVKQVLDMLFLGYFQFREIGNQIIIQPGTASKEKWYVVSGQVKDAVTGHPVSNASVYESMQLISTLTNDQGYFKLRLREKERTAAVLTVSKDLYRDTIMLIPAGHDQEMNASIKPAPPIQLSVVDVNQFNHVEQTWLGGFFLSSRQRMQSLNLSEFFTKQPYQYSIVPAIGTHGKLGSQVINKFSLNMIGGYTAGLNGFEMAGVFNIDQKDVKYVQVAGVFNIVGGHMTGAQIAGLHNQTMDSLDGVQIAGFSNVLKYGFHGAQLSGAYNQARGDAHGAQIAGAINHFKGTMEGVQMAGAINYSSGAMNGGQIGGAVNIRKGGKGVQIAGAVNISTDTSGKGAQIAGAVNINTDTTSGVQISGGVNYAHVLNGVQIGVVNYADSSNGYSIGIINFVRRGYHQVQVYTNEIADLNVVYKSGSRKLYSLLLAGMSLNGNKKLYTFGYGIGHDFHLSAVSYITAEMTSQYIHQGNWDATNSLIRLQTAWNRRLGKKVTLFAGPSFSILSSDKLDVIDEGYQTRIPRHYSSLTLAKDLTAWFGWHIGIGFF